VAADTTTSTFTGAPAAVRDGNRLGLALVVISMAQLMLVLDETKVPIRKGLKLPHEAGRRPARNPGPPAGRALFARSRADSCA